MAKSAKANTVFDATGLIPQKKESKSALGALDTHDTQRKQKHPRINMAFYGDNLEYVREAAYQSRMSVTEYVNSLIVDDKNRKFLERQNTKEKGLEQISIDDIVR